MGGLHVIGSLAGYSNDQKHMDGSWSRSQEHTDITCSEMHGSSDLILISYLPDGTNKRQLHPENVTGWSGVFLGSDQLSSDDGLPASMNDKRALSKNELVHL
jgi:hypothetical protein